MPQRAWSAKRERQYEHVKEGLLERGRSTDKAEEIAARTVNKERAQHGEAREASRTSVEDMPASRRGGLRSHTGSRGRTYDQLRNEARQRGLRGRSKMTKAELEQALKRLAEESDKPGQAQLCPPEFGSTPNRASPGVTLIREHL